MGWERGKKKMNCPPEPLFGSTSNIIIFLAKSSIIKQGEQQAGMPTNDNTGKRKNILSVYALFGETICLSVSLG